MTEKESHKSENCEPRKNNFLLKTLNVSQSANDNDDSDFEETPLNPSNPPSKTKPKSGLWMKVSKNLDSPVLKRKNEVNDINVRLIILNNWQFRKLMIGKGWMNCRSSFMFGFCCELSILLYRVWAETLKVCGWNEMILWLSMSLLHAEFCKNIECQNWVPLIQ